MESKLSHVFMILILTTENFIHCLPTIYSSLNSNNFPATLNLVQTDYPNPIEIDLTDRSSNIPPCATIRTTTYNLIHVPENGKHRDISEGRFIFDSAIVRDQCFLTVDDTSGSYKTNCSMRSVSTCSTVKSVCCECGGCEQHSFVPIHSKSCAILFEHQDCSSCYGFQLRVNAGDQIKSMKLEHQDSISSIHVFPGCRLNIYKGDWFQGESGQAIGSLNLPPEWNDVISSYTCECDDADGTTISPPPTSPTTAKTTISSTISTTTTMSTTISTTNGGMSSSPSTTEIGTLKTTTLPITSTMQPTTTTTKIIPSSSSSTMTTPETTTVPSTSTINFETTISFTPSTTVATTRREETTTMTIKTTTLPCEHTGTC